MRTANDREFPRFASNKPIVDDIFDDLGLSRKKAAGWGAGILLVNLIFLALAVLVIAGIVKWVFF